MIIKNEFTKDWLWYHMKESKKSTNFLKAIGGGEKEQTLEK